MIAPRPNAHGVYPATEHLELPNPAKGWRGCPWAQIDLLRLDDGWRWATGTALPHGGHINPLVDKARAAPTREAAVMAAAGDLRRRMERDTCAAARSIVAWLDTLMPAQMDMFA